MPGVNESSPLAKKLDDDYSEPTLENFFQGFRGMRWDKVTITVDIIRRIVGGVEENSNIAHGTIGGVNTKAITGVPIPNVGEVWWAMRDKAGLYYLDDLAR